MPDWTAQFRDRRGTNRIEKLRPDGDIANFADSRMGGGGGGQRFDPPFGGGGGGGMDAWQSSVEKRLDGLERRLESVEGKIGDIRETLSSVKTKVDDLPTKWFIVSAVSAIGAGAIAIGKLVSVVL